VPLAFVPTRPPGRPLRIGIADPLGPPKPDDEDGIGRRACTGGLRIAGRDMASSQLVRSVRNGSVEHEPSTGTNKRCLTVVKTSEDGCTLESITQLQLTIMLLPRIVSPPPRIVGVRDRYYQ
jgi:hypothetical protein